MALVKCEECGKEISSNVRICSQSGYKSKKSIWDYVLNFFAIVIVFVTIENGFASEVKKNTYLSELETNIFNALVQNQIDALEYNVEPIIRNGNIKEPTLVPIDVIQNEYEKNQIKADEIFRNKIFLTTGKIREIKTTSTGEPVLDFFIKRNTFLNPSAKIKKEYLSWASNLTKQSEVKIVCQIDKFFMDNIKLYQCEPVINWIKAQDWAKITLNTFKNESNQEVDKMMEQVRKIATKVDVNNSNCIGSSFDNVDCIGEVARINDLIEEEKQGKSSSKKPLNKVQD